METLNRYIDELAAGRTLQQEELAALIGCADRSVCRRLHAAAYRVKLAEVGAVVRPRALIEISNLCIRNCRYCGIRAENRALERFALSLEEITAAAARAVEQGYGSLVLQAGERQDEEFIALVETALQQIQAGSRRRIGITLSLGEQTAETYARWFAAGAHRYLLRIETSNPQLFAQIHPARQRMSDRLACLAALRACGYQVGTGVMIGLPGQTLLDLAADVAFFKEIDADMFGMGPYLIHPDTPLGRTAGSLDLQRQLQLGLNMIAVVRLVLRDVNIAATTALQTIAPDGREQGLRAGANVIMPNVTDTRYRPAYALYAGKPAYDETTPAGRHELEERLAAMGETLVYGEWGDAPHFARRLRTAQPDSSDFDTLVGGRV